MGTGKGHPCEKWRQGVRSKCQSTSSSPTSRVAESAGQQGDPDRSSRPWRSQESSPAVLPMMLGARWGVWRRLL